MNNDASFYPERSLRIAEKEKINESHFGMIYQSENNKNYKNILFPFKTDSFTNKQGIFRMKTIKSGLSTPWNDLYIQTNKCKSSINKTTQGIFKAYARDEYDGFNETLDKFIELGTDHALNQIAKKLSNEALSNHKVCGIDSCITSVEKENYKSPDKSPEKDVMSTMKFIFGSEKFKMENDSIEVRPMENLTNEINLCDKPSDHSNISVRNDRCKLIQVNEELSQFRILFTTLMKGVYESNVEKIKTDMNRYRKVLNDVYRNKINDIDINLKMVRWVQDINISPICYDCENSFQICNNFYELFQLTYEEYDQILNNNIEDSRKSDITNFIMSSINAYSFTFHNCFVFCFRFADSKLLNQSEILRLQGARILISNFIVCLTIDQCGENTNLMCLMMCFPEQEVLVLFTFKTGSSIPNEFKCDLIFKDFINCEKLRYRKYLRDNKKFNEIENWKTYVFQTHHYVPTTLNCFHQLYLMYLIIGYQLTIPYEFIKNFRKKNEDCLIVNSMLEFISQFENESASTLVLVTLLNEHLYNDNHMFNDEKELVYDNDNDRSSPVEFGEVGNFENEIRFLIDERRAPLDDEESQKVNNFLSRTEFTHEIIIDKFNINMTQVKLSCLKEGTWLNDEVINFYMCMLQERDDKLFQSNKGKRLSSHYFNSYFMDKLYRNGAYNFKLVKRWTEKHNINIFEKDKIFIPVNISNTHWAMIVAYMQYNSIHYYDSLKREGVNKFLKPAVLRWLKDESAERGIAFDENEWDLIDQESNVPLQDNGVDCGVFSILCADFISDNISLSDSYKQHEIALYRRKICAAILRGFLKY